MGAGSTPAQAAGKLVATGASGRFAAKFMPNGFAGPRAFASVNIDPLQFIPDTERRGISGVRRPFTGVYCLAVTAASGIDPTTAVALVSVNHWYSAGADLLAFWSHPDTCEDDELQVLTFSFDGGLVPSNNVAFSVAVL